MNKGLAKTIFEAMDTGIVDHTWNLDYGKLYEFICGTDAVARLWGSPPPGDSFWNMLHKKGFNPTVYDKNAANKEKKVDTAIASRMKKDAYTVVDKAKDEILLVSGDSDHASGELKRACTKFIPLNAYHGHSRADL